MKGGKKIILVSILAALVGALSFFSLITAHVEPETVEISASPVISVEPSYYRVEEGNNFTINITIDPKGEEIYGVQYELYFNNSVLRAVSQTREIFSVKMAFLHGK